jgi:hypothetical protein
LGAAAKLGVDVCIEIKTDGTIVVTTGKKATTDNGVDRNEWDQDLYGNDQTQVRQRLP